MGDNRPTQEQVRQALERSTKVAWLEDHESDAITAAARLWLDAQGKHPSLFRQHMNDSEFADAYVKEYLLLDWEAMIDRAADELDRVIDDAYDEKLGIGLSLTQGAKRILRAALEVTDG